MAPGRLYLQPTLRQLLNAEALSEAQVLYGDGLLDRQISQVVFGLSLARAGSLVVTRAEALAGQEISAFRDLAGVILIRPGCNQALAGVVGGAVVPSRPVSGIDVQIEPLVKLFAEAGTALLSVPELGEPAQVADDIRLAFQSEIKRASARLHAHFLSCVLENGLQGLVEELSALIHRPVAVETAEFKILAAQNMGPTPPSQQRTLTEEVAEELNREMRAQSGDVATVLPEQPFRIGRRLVMPIVLEGVVVGYLSVMIRPSDDAHFITDYLAPAALAALVDFSHRRKEVSTFTVTQKSLLKDLLSGRSLSAGDQEHLEQHFGFDLCDGLMVFAVQTTSESAGRDAYWPEDRFAMVEMEATHVFVLPYHSKEGKTWQEHADGLLGIIRKNKSELKLQLGAGRIAENLLDLSDAYREARQALIIASMSRGNEEFVVGYGDLGIKRLLYLMIDHPELERFYEENLAPLEAYDAEWESELIPTLRVYLEQGANLNSAAKELFIHRHTMRYRLEQIAEILSVDIDAAEVLLNLQIAFLIRDMKGKARD